VRAAIITAIAAATLAVPAATQAEVNLRPSAVRAVMHNQAFKQHAIPGTIRPKFIRQRRGPHALGCVTYAINSDPPYLVRMTGDVYRTPSGTYTFNSETIATNTRSVRAC
jgi:hypothetical protein